MVHYEPVWGNNSHPIYEQHIHTGANPGLDGYGIKFKHIGGSPFDTQTVDALEATIKTIGSPTGLVKVYRFSYGSDIAELLCTRNADTLPTDWDMPAIFEFFNPIQFNTNDRLIITYGYHPSTGYLSCACSKPDNEDVDETYLKGQARQTAGGYKNIGMPIWKLYEAQLQGDQTPHQPLHEDWNRTDVTQLQNWIYDEESGDYLDPNTGEIIPEDVVFDLMAIIWNEENPTGHTQEETLHQLHDEQAATIEKEYIESQGGAAPIDQVFYLNTRVPK